MARNKPNRGRPRVTLQNKCQDRRETSPETTLPNITRHATQQWILDVFSQCFLKGDCSWLHETLQGVKQHLYNRDFTAAFGRPEYLAAYAARWSPTRALGYLSVLHELQRDGQLPILPRRVRNAADGEEQRAPLRVLGIGAGAGAELMTFAALHRGDGNTETMPETDDGTGGCAPMALRLVDIAAWGPTLELLSTKAKITDERVASFDHSFHQHNVLELPKTELARLLDGVQLVTVFFTMNELFTASLSRTTRFLLDLTVLAARGTTLLVIDSPGSYSTVLLQGKGSTAEEASKQYKMAWLMDHLLLKVAPNSLHDGQTKEPARLWTKVVEEESKWFRLPPDLKYPIALENMRMQIHLYRRCG